MRLVPLLFAIAQFGTIVFPNNGKPEAQEPFLRGVLLLHNFAYPQAQRARRSTLIDRLAMFSVHPMPMRRSTSRAGSWGL